MQGPHVTRGSRDVSSMVIWGKDQQWQAGLPSFALFCFFNLLYSRYLLILVGTDDVSSEVDWSCMIATTPLRKSTAYSGWANKDLDRVKMLPPA